MQRCNITTTDKTGSSSDAYDFIAELNKNKKASSTEIQKVKNGAERIKSMLTFTF